MVLLIGCDFFPRTADHLNLKISQPFGLLAEKFVKAIKIYYIHCSDSIRCLSSETEEGSSTGSRFKGAIRKAEYSLRIAGYVAVINSAGGLYGGNLTEVVSTVLTAFGLYTRPRSRFSHTDRLSSAKGAASRLNGLKNLALIF